MTDYSPSIAEPVHILLVEDNPGDVRLIEEAFKEGRIESNLHAVTDGADALDFLFQRGAYESAPRPELILLDLNLPRMNGEEVLAELQAVPELRQIPVVVLTSSEDEQDIRSSYALDANAYLTKPVDPSEFSKTIRAFERFWLSTVQLPSDGEQT